MSIEERRQELVQKTFRLMLRVLLIFGLPAFAAFFIGEWLDKTYELGSIGMIATLAIAFIISWTLVIRMWHNLNSQFKALDIEEENEQETINKQPTERKSKL